MGGSRGGYEVGDEVNEDRRAGEEFLRAGRYDTMRLHERTRLERIEERCEDVQVERTLGAFCRYVVEDVDLLH